MNWLTAFALTCTVELPILAAVAPKGLRYRASIDSLAANLLTHPLAWYLFSTTAAPWLAIELGVTGVEAVVYALVTRLPPARAFCAAFLANFVTAAISFLV